VNPPDVIAITDPRWADDELVLRAEAVLAAVPRGSVGLQLRDKVRGSKAVHGLAERLRAICSQHDAALYVNDRLDVALAVEADGVHLGEASVAIGDARALLGPAAFISVAAHRLEDVDRARLAGATAVLLSPIFETPEKGALQGTRFLADARARAGAVRIYALGGIDVNNAAECRRAGADGVAVIRAVWGSPDAPTSAVSLVAAARSSG
jgi:thiamine-phosphate pyrophosphorylase